MLGFNNCRGKSRGDPTHTKQAVGNPLPAHIGGSGGLVQSSIDFSKQAASTLHAAHLSFPFGGRAWKSDPDLEN